jgi:hypothetical protein
VGPDGKVVTGEVEGWWIWLMYFIYLYENRTMKPVEIVFKKWEGK